MLLSDEISECGERRIYFTQVASVVSYFTEEDGGGVATHVYPGEFALPWTMTPEKLEAVRQAMLEETACRLGCDIAEVGTKTLDDISLVADPLPATRHHWAARARTRRPGRPAVRRSR